MKHVILDTHRGPKDVFSKVKHKEMTMEQLDSLPDKAGMRPKKNWMSQGDRLGPLRAFLRNNIGRPINNIYRELCEHAEYRTMQGQHLRRHFWMEITTHEKSKWWYRGWGFYEDKNGLLKEYPRKSWRGAYKSPKDPNVCEIYGQRFERIKGCWYFIYIEPLKVKMWSLELNKYVLEAENVSKRKQLNKKELKKLGLSNAPGFIWWE